MHPINYMMTAKVTLTPFSLLDAVPQLVLPPNTKSPQKVPARASEIIGLYDKVSNILWTRQFLEAQGYKIQTNVVYQDNVSTLSLAIMDMCL